MVQVPPIVARTIAAPTTPIIAAATATPMMAPEQRMEPMEAPHPGAMDRVARLAPGGDQLPGAMAVEAPLAGVVAQPRGVTVAEVPRVIEADRSPGAVAR